MITIHAIKCKKCGDIIYSRAVHDYHSCTCGSVSIDGGFEYQKISGELAYFEYCTLKINVTKDKLYNDWNSGNNLYGIIRKKSSNVRGVAKKRRKK